MTISILQFIVASLLASGTLSTPTPQQADMLEIDLPDAPEYGPAYNAESCSPATYDAMKIEVAYDEAGIGISGWYIRQPYPEPGRLCLDLQDEQKLHIWHIAKDGFEWDLPGHGIQARLHRANDYEAILKVYWADWHDFGNILTLEIPPPAKLHGEDKPTWQKKIWYSGYTPDESGGG